MTSNGFQPRLNVATDDYYTSPPKDETKKSSDSRPTGKLLAPPPPPPSVFGCSPLSDLINIDGPTEAGLEVARDRGLVCEPPSRVPPRDFV